MKDNKIFGLIRKGSAVLGFLVMAQAAHAGLIVQSAVSAASGGGFHYEFSIENSGPEEFAILSLNAPTLDPLIAASLVVPMGFTAFYDAGLGFVDFLADISFGVGPQLSGFGFDSEAGPLAGFFNVFTALDLAGNEFTGRVAPIPEPTTLALIAFGGVLLTGSRARRADAH
jgi:hypothetical protein